MKLASNQPSPSKVTKTKEPKARSKNHLVIDRFVKTELAANDKYFWPREMKMAGKMLQKYPIDFLLGCKEPFHPFKLNSLTYFHSQDGQKFLTEQFFEYRMRNTNLTVKKEEIVLSPVKIGEDVIIRRKPKTLQEFLQYGKERNTSN